MTSWNEYEVSTEQKREFIQLLCNADISDEQKLDYLDRLALYGWAGLIGLPSATQTFSFSCEMPNNTHPANDDHAYRCTNTNGDQHTFCRQHKLDKCPIDKSMVNLIP